MYNPISDQPYDLQAATYMLRSFPFIWLKAKDEDYLREQAERLRGSYGWDFCERVSNRVTDVYGNEVSTKYDKQNKDTKIRLAVLALREVEHQTGASYERVIRILQSMLSGSLSDCPEED